MPVVPVAKRKPPIGKGIDRHPGKKKTRQLGAMPLVGGFSKTGRIYKQAKKIKPTGKINIDDLRYAQMFLRKKKK